MKRILQVLLIVICSAGMSFSQQNKLGFATGDGSNAPPIRQGGGMECSPVSLFSQPPINPLGGYFCDVNDIYQFTEVIDDYPALSAGIGKVIFWVGYYSRDYGLCTPGTPATDSYAITFYGLNTGNPAYPGTLIQSFVLSPSSCQLVGTLVYDIYRLEFTLPSTIGAGAGWVGISRLTRTDQCILMWDITDNGYQYLGKQRYNGQLVETSAQFSFCLEGGQPVPLAGWPIILAGVLIAVAVGVRYLKLRS
jgi:hypothetical protein